MFSLWRVEETHKILTMHHKEGKNSQATEIIEIDAKGSAELMTFTGSFEN